MHVMGLAAPTLDREDHTKDIDFTLAGRPRALAGGGQADTKRVGRARERSETQGFMQVLVDASISRTVHIHPTVAELIPTLLGSLQPLQ
jgi:hypothetical protein